MMTGRFAPVHRPADYHPLAARRFAPFIKRMQRTVVNARSLAFSPATDPQAVSQNSAQEVR